VNARIDALRKGLSAPLLVTDLVNIFYLTGFDSSNAALLVEPDGGARLFTDFRYIGAARAIEGVEAVQTKRALLADVAHKLSGPVAFEADILPYAFYEVLRGGGLELVPRIGVVEELRAVKDAEEQAAIRRAARVADRAFEALTAETWIGRSEKEVAWRLRQLMHAHGADDVAFDTAVASGPNGALPHADPSNRTIERGTLVVVDWGVRIGGYCSDCTRTLSTGNPPAELVRAYEVCLEAQKRAVGALRAGITGVDADFVAREVIENEGLGEHFGHGLGHGVGLLIHEAPRLSTESSDTLRAGNVVTIEPGIYLEGVGGVRIEDLASVGEDGLELVTSFPKELVTVG
jgi:Xaa-Pro aminopeptidase